MESPSQVFGTTIPVAQKASANRTATQHPAACDPPAERAITCGTTGTSDDLGASCFRGDRARGRRRLPVVPASAWPGNRDHGRGRHQQGRGGVAPCTRHRRRGEGNAALRRPADRRILEPAVRLPQVRNSARSDLLHARGSDGKSERKTRTENVHSNTRFAACTVEDESGTVALNFTGADVEGELVVNRREAKRAGLPAP